MALFLFALSMVVFTGGFINSENSGKTDIYAENPKTLADDVVDSVTDAYKDSDPIVQEKYKKYND